MISPLKKIRMVSSNHSDENVAREQIGFFIFTKEDLLEKKYKLKIIQFIAHLLNSLAELPDFINTNSDSTKYKQFTPQRFEEFKKDFINFKYVSDFKKDIHNLCYIFDAKKGGEKDETVGDFRIYIDINGNINHNPNLKLRGIFCHELAFFISPKISIKHEKIMELITNLFTNLKCCYGYINPVLAYSPSPEAASILRDYMISKEGIFDIPTNRGNSEFYSTSVKGAMWGSFITKEHLSLLGGKESIVAKLDNFVIDNIEKDALFIRMPFELSIENCQKNTIYYKKLAKAFEPIFIPKWHSGDTGVIVGGDFFLRRFLLSENEKTAQLNEITKSTKYWKERLAPIMKKVKEGMKR